MAQSHGTQLRSRVQRSAREDFGEAPLVPLLPLSSPLGAGAAFRTAAAVGSSSSGVEVRGPRAELVKLVMS